MVSGKGEKPRHLGRGLEALLGPVGMPTTTPSQIPARMERTIVEKVESQGLVPLPPDKVLGDSFQNLELASIQANPYQARTVWNEEDLRELADSIKANGVVQPIIVRPFQGSYQLIAGERRFRAAQMVGLKTIPAVIREVTDEQLFEWSLVENIHRRDLNPIERAKAYQHYLGAFSLTQTEAAERLGEDRSVIANYLRLLDLPEDLKQMLASGQLSMGHARAILAVPTDELRRKLANRALAGRLSVREVERLVRLHLAERPASKQTPRAKPAHIVDLEGKLCRHLGTRVSIETNKSGRSGRIVIDFDSLDEFERITDVLGIACGEET
ncbi:MAG TPA: ParB/RepB/Spo0J family partition protein [Sedimentisphaerales bacterium]|nr:ParB/RepB/Spo0J family partition protein [Sedimentisphaerales bacterium]